MGRYIKKSSAWEIDLTSPETIETMKRHAENKEKLSALDSNDLMYTQSRNGAFFKNGEGPEVLISEWDGNSFLGGLDKNDNTDQASSVFCQRS